MNYTFRSGIGAALDVGNGNVIWDGGAQRGSGRGGYDDLVTAGLSIGFTFRFDGVDYSTFSVTTNGLIGLGNTATTAYSNSLTGAGTYPILAPFWDDLRVSGGVQGCAQPKVTVATLGTAPARILVVEWRSVDIVYRSPRYGTFQARLYEGTNTIEYLYSDMKSCDKCNRGYGCSSTSATIAIASSSSRYISVTPTGGSSATTSTTTANNSANMSTAEIDPNTLYSFVPCEFQAYGLTGAGRYGTAALNNGDVFFNNINTQMGNQTVFTPLWTQMSDALCTGSVTYTISGAAASDYYFGTPGTTTRTVNFVNGLRDTAKITFKPTTTGQRPATLTVTSGTYTRTFTLNGYSPNIAYTGIIPQGGTSGMNSGDTLFKGITVLRHTSQGFTPFTLTNIAGAPRTITYTLNDPTGQYSITPGGTLAANASTTPTITFSPTRFGPQKATLTVDAQGETRTFTLLAISAAPGGDLVNNGTVIDSNSTFFTNAYSCVGDQGVSIPITIRNTGYNEYIVNSVDVYRIDTTYAQGRPRYPYVRDEQGRLELSNDYILTNAPNVVPSPTTSVNFPIVIPEGGSTTVYLTFISRRPTKQFARVFFRTNGESSSSPDTNGVAREGIISFEVFGRGMGSGLSDNMKGGLPKAIVFPETHVGDAITLPYVLYNSGVCPLRISLPSLNIVAGDVDEFEVVKMPTTGIDQTTGDLVLAPGSNDTVWIRFAPRQMGSRRAGLRLMTNDSTIVVPGITERGVYYLDLFGTGKADIYVDNVDFGQALIGGTGADQIHRGLRLKNTLNVPLTIQSITIEGTDAGEFTQDATGWPTLPFTLNGGQDVLLPLVFGPVAGGQTGARTATVKIVTTTGDTVISTLNGIAGTRTIAVTPTTMNFGTVSAGKLVRKTLMITNNGTMPVTLTAPSMSLGSDFTVGTLPRMTLEPNQTEYLEVTYAPQASGGSTATLTIGSNATAGAVQVTLNGTAPKTKQVVVDPSQTTAVTGNGNIFSPNEDLSVSGVGSEELVNGMALFQSVPNPARDQVEIGYRIAKAGEVRLELYDASGRLVKVLESGYRGVGEQRVRVNVSDLASGVYHYRLTAGGQSLSRSMNVTK